jgi:hypothetical protein
MHEYKGIDHELPSIRVLLHRMERSKHFFTKHSVKYLDWRKRVLYLGGKKGNNDVLLLVSLQRAGSPELRDAKV